MLNIDRRRRSATSGLACPLDEASASLAQSSGSPSGTHLEPLTRLKAISILLDQHDDNVFAYLRFARSLHQNVLYFPGHGSLSLDQYLAIWALRDSSDVEIKTWLKEARKLSSDSGQRKYPYENALQEPGFAYLSSSEQARERLHGPAAGTSPSLFQTQGSRQSTSIGSSVHPPRALDKTYTSQEATKDAKLYWCTICEDRHSYKNLSDWRKHEKEHVETYVCMLTGSVDKTEGYVKCPLCGTSNPSERHLGAHNTQVCGQGIPGSFSCKRRADLVKHLKRCHNVQEKAQAVAVADKWKEITEKQAWSCGFCVCLFHTFGDRLKHIAKHFEQGQTLDEWDTTRVIEGLLTQPIMVNVWRMPLDWRFSEITWNKDAVKDLQRALELGPSDPMHAKALVEAVYSARQLDSHLLSHDRSFASLPDHEASGTRAFGPISDHASIMHQVLQPSSNHGHAQFVNPADTIHSGVPAMNWDLTASYDYRTVPGSFSDEDGSSIKGPWLPKSGLERSLAADQYITYSVNQEQSNAATGMRT